MSHDTVLALAGMVPFGILAEDAEAYKQVLALQGSAGSLTKAEKTQIREKEQQNLFFHSLRICFKRHT